MIQHTKIASYIVGGWTTPLKHMLVKLDHFPYSRVEHQKIFETTTQYLHFWLIPPFQDCSSRPKKESTQNGDPPKHFQEPALRMAASISCFAPTRSWQPWSMAPKLCYYHLQHHDLHVTFPQMKFSKRTSWTFNSHKSVCNNLRTSWIHVILSKKRRYPPWNEHSPWK